MNKKHFLFLGLSLSTITTIALAPAVKADDIDEKQKLMMSKINEAASNKQLSPKDASVLRKEMADFDKKKRALKSAGSDVLSADDDATLNKALNAVSQDFDKKFKN